MLREYTVLSRLHAAYPRAPLGLHYCADPAVIGAHFLVSEYRPGVVVWDHVPEELAVGPEPGRRIGFAVVDALADLHLVDPAGCDLGYLGRPDGYLDRQLRGWQRRWEAVATDGRRHRGPGRRAAGPAPARVRPARAWSTTTSRSTTASSPRATPTAVTSVFDWDMATLGDPLTDLGTLLNYWPDGATPAEGVPGVENLGLPSRDEVVERYAARTRRHLTRA